jgi:tetratricopeptide (TPR) repeat protein
MIMSYINEALQKAQKENESNYAAYGNIISAAPEKVKQPAQRSFVVWVIILSSLVAVMVFLLYGQLDNKKPAVKQTAIPPAVTSTGVTAPGEVRPAAEKVPPTMAALPAVLQPLPENIAILPVNAPAQIKSEPAQPTAKSETAGPDTLFAQAVQKQNEGKLMEAKELYRKVIKSDPRNVQALNNLGVVYLARKNFKWAAIRFNDALAIKPDYADVHYNLACLYSQKKDFTRSLHYLKKAFGLNPEVRKWAKKDPDLRELSRLPDFNNLLEGQEN